MLEKLQLLTLAMVSDLGGQRDEKGATAVEYGLMVALVAGVIAAMVTILGTHVLASFQLMVGLWP